MREARDRVRQPAGEDDTEQESACERDRAPDDGVADHQIDRGEGQVPVALD
jgi:hypothetical protein